MKPILQIQNSGELPWKQADAAHYKGLRLSGIPLYKTGQATMQILSQDFHSQFYHLGIRTFHVKRDTTLILSESISSVRLEIPLMGLLSIADVTGKNISLPPAHYQLSSTDRFHLSLPANSESCYMVCHYLTEFLEQSGLSEIVSPSPILLAPEAMLQLVHEILHHPYDKPLQQFFYENAVRELLFLHLSQLRVTAETKLKNKDIDAIYAADSILRERFQENITIPQLALLAGINEFKLKKGFREIIGTSVFKRLIYWRMEHAKLLLETTQESVASIALQTGYRSTPAFSAAFRALFTLTPLEWRNEPIKKMKTGNSRI